MFDRSEFARSEDAAAHAALGVTHRAVKLLLASGAAPTCKRVRACSLASCVRRGQQSAIHPERAQCTRPRADACVRCPHLFLLLPDDATAERACGRPRVRSPGAGVRPGPIAPLLDAGRLPAHVWLHESCLLARPAAQHIENLLIGKSGRRCSFTYSPAVMTRQARARTRPRARWPAPCCAACRTWPGAWCRQTSSGSSRAPRSAPRAAAAAPR